MSGKIYINSDIDIPISLSGDINVTDIDDISVTFTNLKDPLVVLEFKKSTGEITIIDSVITLSISKTAVTVAGVYGIAIQITETSGKLRGLEPKPEKIIFN